MAFNFGGQSSFLTPTTSLGFGSTTTTKPTGFGTSFFGGTTSTAPAFGLGAAPPATATGFAGFGTTPATTATGFSGFGTAPATTATGFSGFGSTPATTAPGFSGFGTTPATSTGFGFGGFGATGTTATPSFGGFNAFGTTSTAPTFGGFGTTPAATSSTGLFSNFGQTGAAGTAFGTKPAAPSFSFNSGLGGAAAPSFGLSFGQQPAVAAAPVAQPPVDQNQAMYNSLFNCHVYGDERDVLLGKWNLVQSLWGCGRGFYDQQGHAVEYDMKNPLCRFKAISYSMRPKADNKDGLVALVFNKKESEMRSLEAQLVSSLVNILGNKPNLSPGIESMKPMSDTKTVVNVFVQEKSATGAVSKISASDLAAYLLQPTQKQQLSTLLVDNVYPYVSPTEEQIKEYLDNPPAGIDAAMWKTAQEENPCPEKLLPVPLIGFADIGWRMQCQLSESLLHGAFLDKMADDIDSLQRKNTATVSKIQEYKRRFSELQHRILKVLIVQEESRKMGMALLPEEERLKTRLEAISATINSQSLKNRLAELTEGVKLHSEISKEPQKYKMDASVIAEMKQFLTMEQAGMTHIIDTIQSDLSDLKAIKDCLRRTQL